MRQTLPHTQLLLFECPDQMGITSKITTLLLARHLNIVSIFEYVDIENKRFFMRLEVEGKFSRTQLMYECQQALGKEAIINFPDNAPKKLVIFASHEPYCLADIAVRCLYQELNCEILACISDHPSLESLAKRFEIPFYYIPVERSRLDHEESIHQVLDGHKPDYLVMAKYMRILTSNFVDRYPNRIINIHHSFLPAFIGYNPYLEAYHRGVKLIGATAHFVTEQLDDGPIIVQDTIPINHATSIHDMQVAGHDIEKKCLARALHLVAEDRVFTYNNRTIVFE